jgi:chemotaxis protein MotA
MTGLDYRLPIGLFIGTVAILGSAAYDGISLKFLWQPTAAMVVAGGTLGAVVIRRGIPGLLQAVRASMRVFIKETPEETEAVIVRIAWLARLARREGVKALEIHADKSSDPLIVTGLSLSADLADAATVKMALDRVLDDEYEYGMRQASTFEAAGSFAPTFGIIGAVLGLIHVLRYLTDPNAIGLGIATAFVATFYGVGLANILFLPLASRLRDHTETYIKDRELIAKALVKLAAKEPPTSITQSFQSKKLRTRSIAR